MNAWTLPRPGTPSPFAPPPIARRRMGDATRLRDQVAPSSLVSSHAITLELPRSGSAPDRARHAVLSSGPRRRGTGAPSPVRSPSRIGGQRRLRAVRISSPPHGGGADRLSCLRKGADRRRPRPCDREPGGPRSSLGSAEPRAGRELSSRGCATASGSRENPGSPAPGHLWSPHRMPASSETDACESRWAEDRRVRPNTLRLSTTRVGLGYPPREG